MEILLANCRKNNTRDGVTGLLISHQGLFIQYIEGQPHHLNALFEKIKRDSRHHSVIELTSGLISERQFSNWSMAFKKIDKKEAEEILGYQTFEKKEAFTSQHKYGNYPAMELLNSFINNL